MSQTTIYAPVLAKIGAERSNLLSEAKLKTLAESKSLIEFTTQLRETTYQEQIAKVPLPLTSRKLERAFNENLIEAYVKIIANSPKNSAKYLCNYLHRFEVENIKALIKGANANLSAEQKLAKIYLSVEAYFKNSRVMEEAAKAQAVKQTVNSLKGTMYASALNMGLQSYEEGASTASMDIFLDKLFYENLHDTYENLPKKEKPHAYFYASTENDSFTLLTLLRGKVLNYDANWLRLVVPHEKFNLSPETVEALVSASDFDSALKLALDSYYGEYFVKAQKPEETLANAEKAFQRAIVKHAKVKRILETFNIGAALAFMEQKGAEVRNLIALSSGVEAGVSSEYLQSQLLL